MASKAKILKSIQHFDNVGKEIERFEERIRDAIAEPDCSAALIDVLKSKIEKYEKKLEETFSELNIDVDNCNESVRNLTVLGLEINQLSELIIINHCTSKLHEEIAHCWELTLKPDTYPTLQAFRMFIESEARALGLLSGNADAPKSKLGTNNASQLSLISGRLKEKLDIPVKSEKHKISGINGVNAETSLHSCTIEFTPHFSSLKFNLEAIVLNKVTSPLPNFQFKNRQFPHLKNLKLADPNFHTSKPIDVFLGAEIYADLLEGLPIFGPAGTPTAIPTKLGYILSGKIYAPLLKESIVNSSLSDQLSELWKLDEVPKTNAKIQIPNPCEESFSKSVKRNNEGRYIVNLPFKENNTLGESKEKAVQLLYALENKFHKNKQFKDNFLNFMNEYLALGHMREISQKRDDEIPNCYLPYHMVTNEKSTTTKCRVVFNASSKTKNGDEESKQRVLGLIWNLKTDSIQVKVVHEEIVKTKRQLLSVIAQIFDPLGLFSPSVITLKIMLQELWKSKALWDDPIPSSILENWNKFTKESKYLNSISIPRFMGIDQNSDIILHGFFDASTKAYAAVVYLKSKQEIHLVSAKTRVAPIKQLTIPRLELCGALLLAELI
ncbi:uncharacterized protein TNCV_4509911 [Trichonephila clavipes]|nr:uncharacterized protein TNCV_4509911 [Trichonephila clavipes]